MTEDGPEPRFRRRSRAVSDLLAFIVVFAVIVTSVGIVYTVGYGSIVDFTDATESESADRAFEVVTQRLGEIERGNTPAWRGEFDLSGGSTSITTGTQFQVLVNVSSGADRTYSPTAGALVYETDGTAMYYEAGALFRESGDRSAMVDAPPIRCEVGTSGPDRAVVSVVRINPVGSTSRASSGTVEVEARHNETSVLYPENRTGVASAGDAGFVNVSVSGGENAPAWNRYFRQSDAWAGSGSGPFTCPADRVYLRVVTIDVDI